MDKGKAQWIISKKGINRKTHIKTLQSWIMSKISNEKLKSEREVENVHYISIQDNTFRLECKHDNRSYKTFLDK